MAQTTAEKKSRFARVAVPRVEKVVDQFRMLGNCSVPSQYEWDKALWKKVFVHVLIAAQECAEKFDLKVTFTINEIDSRDLYDPDAIEAFLNE